jgi:hypothetical protein
MFTDVLRAPLGWPGTVADRARHHGRRLRHHARRVKTNLGEQRETRRRGRSLAALRLDPELARKLLETVEEPPPFPGVAGLTTTVFDQQRCPHCLGLHSRKCPAVSELEYHPDGRVQRVTYFRHGDWPEDQVLWREDLEEAAAWRDGPRAA